MPISIRLRAVSAAALILGAAPAFAAVTAQDVWDDWQAQMNAYGNAGVTVGSESYAGGVLTVTDLGFASEADDGTTARGTLPQLVLTENGDGTVSVTMSESLPIEIHNVGDASVGEKDSDVTLNLVQSGMAITVSGEPGALVYDLSAARYGIELGQALENGAPVDAALTFALNDVAGSYTSTLGAMRDVTYDLAATSLDILMDVPNTDDGSHLMLSGKVTDVTTQATMSMPIDAGIAPEMMMQAGLAIDGGYATGGGQYMFEFTDPAAGTTSGTIVSAGSTLDFAVDRSAVSYSSMANGLELQVTPAAMPVPVNLSIGGLGATFAMPLAKSDAAAPFAMGLNLTDLAVDEQLWAMVDPSSMIPHDPATVHVALSGTAKVLFDVLDPSQTAAMEAAPMPVEVQTISLDTLNVAFGGASVTGSGAFTLDNTDLTTFPGMPRPTGALDLQVNGLNGLLDTLVSMGLVPADQLMMPRMMMGMFMTSVGDDQFTSRIEVTPDGTLTANGMPLQ